jgi:hypothetical protein
MRKLFLGVLILAFALNARADDKDSGDLRIPGGATVPIPAEGYKWQKVREIDNANSPKVSIYNAAKEGSAAKIVLIVEQTSADSDAKKIARIKGDYNGLVTSLQEQGYTDLRGPKPPIDPPVKERVSFSFVGKDKDGKPAAFQSVLFFGKNVYHFQVQAASEDEAKTLGTVAESIKE